MIYFERQYIVWFVERTRALIMHVLQGVGGQVHAMRLVKLTYLVDYVYAQNYGKTYTGLQYMWDHFGPNAVSHAIVNEAQALAAAGRVRSSEETTIYGSASRKFGLSPGATLPPLEPAASAALRDVLAVYGRLSLEKLVAATKNTKPFESAAQYALLEMPAKGHAEAATSADVAAFHQDVARSGTVTVEELRTELGLR